MKRFGNAWLTAMLLAVPAAAPAQLAPIDQPFSITAAESLTAPRVATRPDGTYLVVWNAKPPQRAVAGRFFGPGGAALTPPFQIASGQVDSVAAAVLPDGGFVAVWVQSFVVEGSVHDRDGRVRIPPARVSDGLGVSPAVAVGADGGWMVAWETPGNNQDVRGRCFGPDGTARTPPFFLSVRTRDDEFSPALVALPEGGFFALWASIGFLAWPPEGGYLGRAFDGAGAPLGPEMNPPGGNELAFLTSIPGQGPLLTSTVQGNWFLTRVGAQAGATGPAVRLSDWRFLVHPPAADSAGRIVVTGWERSDLKGQVLDAANLQPLSRRFTIPTATPVPRASDLFPSPVLASAQPGQFLMAWEDEARLFGEIHALGCENPGLGLCLAQGRFRVEVSWHDGDQNGEQNGQGDHPARAVPLRDDTGAFWFFSPSNPELLVKILDGRAVNGHCWLFYGSLSDVGYDIRVTDTETDEVRVYTNPAGTLASHADTEAFPAPAGDVAPVVAAAKIPGGLVHGTAAPFASSTDCHSSDTALCLSSSYEVTVDFVDPGTGETRQARTAPFSADSGAFWFFGEANLDLFVKVLDGTAVNGHVWVFHGALTDVEYTLTVRAPGGEEWTYHNPRGHMHSGADTSAFLSGD